MINHLFHWTGAAVWTLIALVGLWLVGEVIYAAAVTVSWFRFVYVTLSRQNGKPPAILGWAKTILYKWIEFIGFRPGRESTHWSHENWSGYWKGISNWKVYQSKDTQE